MDVPGLQWWEESRKLQRQADNTHTRDVEVHALTQTQATLQGVNRRRTAARWRSGRGGTHQETKEKRNDQGGENINKEQK